MKKIVEWFENNIPTAVLGIVVIILLIGFILGAIIF